MSVLFIAVPLALLFAACAVLAFLWAARGGQLDDLDTPPLRMLHDDDVAGPRPKAPGRQSSGDGPGAGTSVGQTACARLKG